MPLNSPVFKQPQIGVKANPRERRTINYETIENRAVKMPLVEFKNLQTR